jgi:hypothetical protein
MKHREQERNPFVEKQMKMKQTWCVLLCLAFPWSQVQSAKFPVQALPGEVVAQAPDKEEKDKKEKDKKAKPKTERPAPTPPRPTTAEREAESVSAGALGEPPSAESEASAGLNANMMGDFPARFALRPFLIPGFHILSASTMTTFGTTTTTTITPVLVPAAVRVAIPIEGAFKIAENESPRPQDRVFLTYNYYNNLTGPPSAPLVEASSATMGITTITTATVVPPATLHTDVHREVIGFEKTFLDGNASFGLRAPLFEQVGDGSFGHGDIGDLTLILKYALINDHVSGDVISAGLALTAPTGPAVSTVAGNVHDVLLQPYLGYIWNQGRFYLQGFSSLVVPTDDRDVTILFNDIGLNYRLYCGAPCQTIRFVIPTLEAHVTTPLDHRDAISPIIVPDLVVLTGGVHVGLGCRSILSLGIATPVTGPRAFHVEALAQLNWRF